ncbi:MAG: hypothetical protein J6Q93_02415 [Prevotella sp.]|nr:hypothetical protein [Prevotella sp.]
MRRIILSIVAMLTISLSANAMTYEQARNEALFLTDKMAYELNLSSEQYEAAYEINLDYLMGVTSRNDVFGTYWERRNLDMSYILLEWQWNAFRAAAYFFRPLYWDAGYWHFRIYARYPRRHYLYFGRPAFYATYRGGHSWRHHGQHGYYHGRTSHFHSTGSRNQGGMRDRWDRGEYRNRPNGIGSSTTVTVNRNGRDNNRGNSNFGKRRDDRVNNKNNAIDRHDNQQNHGSRPSINNGERNTNGVSGGQRGGFGNNRNSSSTTSRRPSTINRNQGTSIRPSNSGLNKGRIESLRGSSPRVKSQGQSNGGGNRRGNFGGHR